VLAKGVRTADLAGKTHATVSTAEMGQRVVEAVKSIVDSNRKKMSA
jgi:hypothetical protein